MHLMDHRSKQEGGELINRTRKLSYQVWFLTTYSLGLQLSDALHLTVADVDSQLIGVQVRCGASGPRSATRT